MSASAILVLGSGHLALRVRQLAAARGLPIVPLPASWNDEAPPELSRYEAVLRALGQLEMTHVARAVLVDDHDERNLELAIALLSLHPRLPVYVAMFNENVAPHLQAANPNLHVLNPARIAAPVFVGALDTPLEHALRYEPRPQPPRSRLPHSDRLLRTLVGVFALVIAAATTYFHFADQLSWLDAFYFVVVTVATVGYGDVNLLHSSTVSKWVGIALILASTVFIWMIFSLTVDRIIKTRVQMALGRRRHTQRGHVILCGLGRLGSLVGERLLERGERVLIVEQNEDSLALDHLRAMGADVYIGDARSPRVLHDAGVTRAKALYSLIANDFVNLEIGLNARSFDPKLRLVLRIFDESMSRRIREQLDIHLSFSMSAIADERFLEHES